MVYVITGGAGGIGMSIAKSLKGKKILITGINSEELSRAKSELSSEGVEVETAICDVSNRDSVKELVEKTKSIGKLKAIINCAGVSGAQAGLELVYKVDFSYNGRILQYTGRRISGCNDSFYDGTYCT